MTTIINSCASTEVIVVNRTNGVYPVNIDMARQLVRGQSRGSPQSKNRTKRTKTQDKTSQFFNPHPINLDVVQRNHHQGVPEEELSSGRPKVTVSGDQLQELT